ncbi:MAG: inositol monophosphatase family protein [Chitinivorax sp.]|jgi:myo-inositol-1(or 4)-monophosphatase
MPEVNQQILEQVIDVVRRVAQTEVMPRFLKVAFARKHDGTTITEADIASQAALNRELRQVLNVPVLGEEMSADEQQHFWDQGDEGMWCVDPIDGTTNFVHGVPHFAVSVAFMRNGRSELGVIYNPAMDEMYYALKGHGAFLNGERLPLKSFAPPIHSAVAGIELKYLPGKLPSRLMSVAPYSSQRNIGSSTLDWCWLAAGRFDLILHGGQRLWDYAAGCLILEEAGGKLGSIHHRDFWEDQLWHRSAVAALNPELFEQWYAWVQANK